MSPILYVNLIILLISYIHGFDPNTDICENFILDAAVCADDGNTYIFKGGYYWLTNNLKEKSGIISVAKSVSSKWPELTERVDGCFTLPDLKGRLMTVFLMKNKWFSYQNGKLVMSGSTSQWQAFPHNAVSTAFASSNRKGFVYVLFDGYKSYGFYDLTNINRPKLIRVGATTVFENNVWFLDTSPSETKLVVTHLLDLKAVLTYEELYILISPKNYCFVNPLQEEFEKQCHLKSYKVSNLFGCPLKIVKKPNGGSGQTEDIIQKNPEPIINQSNDEHKTKKESSNKSILPIIISVVVVVIIIVLIVIGVIAFIIVKRRKTSGQFVEFKDTKSQHSRSTSKQPDTISYVSVNTINSTSGSIINKSKESKTSNKSK